MHLSSWNPCKIDKKKDTCTKKRGCFPPKNHALRETGRTSATKKAAAFHPKKKTSPACFFSSAVSSEKKKKKKKKKNFPAPSSGEKGGGVLRPRRCRISRPRGTWPRPAAPPSLQVSLRGVSPRKPRKPRGAFWWFLAGSRGQCFPGSGRGRVPFSKNPGTVRSPKEF